jgi:DNA recombination protein RmuC
VLRTIDFIWKQHKQTENAKQIAEAAKDFYARVVTFTEHLERIGDGLGKANEAFNKAATSFQTRVRPAGERLTDLGGGTPGKELADVAPLDATLRLPPGGS